MSHIPETALHLFDGAHVTLRNGEQFIIRPNKEGMHGVFPWTAEGSVPRRSWTDKGQFVEGDIKPHPFDIMFSKKVEPPKPHPNFDNILIGTAGAKIERGMTIMKNDEGLLVPATPPKPVAPRSDEFEYTEIPYTRSLVRHKYFWRFHSIAVYRFTAAFTELDGELFDSQRTWVFDAETGKCKVCPDGIRDKSAHDIISMIMRVPLVEHDAAGTPWTPPERTFGFDAAKVVSVRIDSSKFAKAGLDRVAEAVANNLPLYDAAIAPAVTETAQGILRHFMSTELVGEPYDPALLIRDEPDPFEDEINQDQVKSEVPLYADYVPGKHLMRLMKNMAKALGGEFDDYKWLSASSVAVAVRFKNRLRSGNLVDYVKDFTITVEGCDNNAHLPMKKVTR